MRGKIRDNMAIFIITHCPCLLSIDISADYNGNQITDYTLQSIAEHCTGLQSISLKRCREITDNGTKVSFIKDYKQWKIYYKGNINKDRSQISGFWAFD